MYLIPFIISVAVGMFILLAVVYDKLVLGNADLNSVAVGALFLILGLGGILIRSKKERKLLEDHLLKICKYDN